MKLLIFSATFLCLLLSGAFVRAEQYRIVTEEWAPYNYRERNELVGLATEIVQQIMALTGDDFEIVMLPSMRAGRELQTRPRTIMYSVFLTEKREPLYKWVGPLLEASIHPYQLTDTPQPVNTLDELRRLPKITTRHAGLIPQLLESKGFDNLDKTAARSSQLYRMLLAGRADVIVGDTDDGVAYHARQMHIAPGTLRRVPVEIYRASLYIAFSADCDDALVASWAGALEQLRRTGELQRIQSQYQ